MQTYWQNATNPNNIARGLYIIFPFRYRDSFQSIAIDDKDKEIPPLIFDSGDFIELLSVKCRNGNFVKRFNLNSKLEEIKEEWYRKAEASKIYHLNDLQLFIFNNGIAFITTYFAYKNEDVDKVYQLINPGYVKEKSEEKQLFYIWGHSYEFDVNNNWKRMEEILDRLIGHNNIFYGTNREVLLPC